MSFIVLRTYQKIFLIRRVHRFRCASIVGRITPLGARWHMVSSFVSTVPLSTEILVSATFSSRFLRGRVERRASALKQRRILWLNIPKWKTLQECIWHSFARRIWIQTGLGCSFVPCKSEATQTLYIYFFYFFTLGSFDNACIDFRRSFSNNMVAILRMRK